jgi:hypothetical protein
MYMETDVRSQNRADLLRFRACTSITDVINGTRIHSYVAVIPSERALQQMVL